MSNKDLKKDNNILISILIPTKNRYTTLIPVINSIIANTSFENFEIVVQDNSDENDDFLDFFEKNPNDKIKYFYKKESIPISDNTELAISNSSGEYLVFIGDDDFISPAIFDITQTLKEKDISCLMFECGYYWWDTVLFSKENHYNRPQNLWIPNNPSMDLIKMSCQVELQKTLEKGAISYYSLPRFYHGIVRKSLLDKIKEKTGKALIGSCPDISFAVSLSLVTDKYYYMNYPVTIFGASKNSGGGWTARKSHFGKLEDMKFLRHETVKNWDTDIPRIWSQRTIYPQTTKEVLSAFDKNNDINYIPLYTAMLIYETYLFKYIYPKVISYCNKSPKRYVYFFTSLFKKVGGNLIKRLRTVFKKLNYKVYRDVDPIKLITILKSI